jgi:hypothetical protein
VAGVREQANDAVAACEQEADARPRAGLPCVSQVCVVRLNVKVS